jgi:hypothetical protein
LTREERIEQMETRLEAYRAAELAILSGAQSYSINNRTLTRANLETINKMIRQLEGDLTRLCGGNMIRLRRAVPLDL